MWFFLFLLLIVALVSIPRRTIEGRRWFLLRVLFPSWRFFESIGVGAELEFRDRPKTVPDGWSDWRPAFSAPRCTLGTVLLNANGNLHFARQSAVEHLVADIEAGLDSVSLADSVSYRLVQRLIPHDGRPYQFRVRLRDVDGSVDDLLLSPEICSETLAP